MARKKNGELSGTTTETRRTKDWSVQFVDIYLSDADKQALAAWSREDGDFYAMSEALVTRGYKVSASYDDRNECYCYSITAGKTCDVPENSGLCMVSRGSSLWKAFLAACYKLEVYCPGGRFPRGDRQQHLDFE